MSSTEVLSLAPWCVKMAAKVAIFYAPYEAANNITL